MQYATPDRRFHRKCGGGVRSAGQLCMPFFPSTLALGKITPERSELCTVLYTVILRCTLTFPLFPSLVTHALSLPLFPRATIDWSQNRGCGVRLGATGPAWRVRISEMADRPYRGCVHGTLQDGWYGPVRLGMLHVTSRVIIEMITRQMCFVWWELHSFVQARLSVSICMEQNT